MRILPAYFAGGDEFLAAYRSEAPEFDGPALAVRTRMDLAIGEHVLAEIALPRLPNREHLRAEVTGPLPDGEGVWLLIGREDRPALDFVVATARRQASRAVTRHHERYPVALPCDWQVDGERTRVLSLTEDLSAGGVFVRAFAPPEVGTELLLSLPTTRLGPLSLHGQVAWVRREGQTSGMGVRFSSATEADAKRLRELLRRSGESGRVELTA